jgi:hypothetical protein
VLIEFVGPPSVSKISTPMSIGAGASEVQNTLDSNGLRLMIPGIKAECVAGRRSPKVGRARVGRIGPVVSRTPWDNDARATGGATRLSTIITVQCTGPALATTRAEPCDTGARGITVDSR